MRRFSRQVMGAGMVTLVMSAPAFAQADFQWRGALAQGQSVEIKGVNGDVHAAMSQSGQVEVTARRTARRSNPTDVKIVTVPHPGGVTICAVYPSSPDREANTCEPGGRGHNNTRDNDTVVHFEVRVPPGVGFIGRTVNGEVEADALQSDAQAHTVNGSVKLTTTGLATAATVNGSVNVTMGRADWPDGGDFKTVNGGITLTLPSVFDADVRADTLNGNISSDFPITVTGTVSPRRLRGTVGSGGHNLTLSTVNGSIKLLRAQ
jgi:Putative adhesin